MVKSINYPGADRETRWKGYGNATLPTINKIVLHTTESSGLPSYTNNWPNLTYDPKNRKWYQHTPINGSATALRNDGSHQSNRANLVQVEIIGFARDSASLPQYALDDLGAFVAWMHTEWDVPLVTMPIWTGPNTTARLLWEPFVNFKGMLGHQHVPGNEHWDPGPINANAIIAAAKLIVDPPKPPAKNEYVVVVGDTYYGIARKLKIDIDDLQKANPTIPPNALVPGMVLKLPGVKPPPIPQPIRYKEIPFWVTHFNVLETAFEKDRDLAWRKRLPLIVKFLKDSKSSIFILNECGPDEANDIAREMGSQWTWDRFVENTVMRDKNKWTETRLIEKYLSGPTHGYRRTLMGVVLKHNENEDFIITVGSSHFETVGSGWVKTEAEAQKMRDIQAKEVISALGLPSLKIWAADTNDRDVSSGPVAIAKAAGYKLLDEIVTVSGPNWSTDNHHLIDRFFISPDLKVTEARRTDPGEASDHLLTTVRVVGRVALP